MWNQSVVHYKGKTITRSNKMEKHNQDNCRLEKIWGGSGIERSVLSYMKSETLLRSGKETIKDTKLVCTPGFDTMTVFKVWLESPLLPLA